MKEDTLGFSMTKPKRLAHMTQLHSRAMATTPGSISLRPIRRYE